jgi:hypothetical protein
MLVILLVKWIKFSWHKKNIPHLFMMDDFDPQFCNETYFACSNCSLAFLDPCTLTP